MELSKLEEFTTFPQLHLFSHVAKIQNHWPNGFPGRKQAFKCVPVGGGLTLILKRMHKLDLMVVYISSSLKKRGHLSSFFGTRKFINECPSGLITLHEFQRHFCDGTVGSESAEYAEQIFRTLDCNGVSEGPNGFMKCIPATQPYTISKTKMLKRREH